MNKFVFALIGLPMACAGSICSSAPIAFSNGDGRVAVTYRDLDLRSVHDQRRLAERISYAVYLACLTDGSATPSPLAADPACKRAASSSAYAQMRLAIERATTGAHLSQGEANRE